MAGIVVQNTVSDPGGAPYDLGWVRITLITGVQGGAGYTASGDTVGTFSVQTDATGHWSVALTPNASFTPANTYYQVVEGSAVSNIAVPASGGPYNLSQLLVTPPPTPSGAGITGEQIAANGAVAGVRPEVNLVAGSGMLVSAADNPGANRVDVTLTSTGGASPATTVVTEQAYGQVASVGVDLTYAREDHTHGSPALTTSAPATTEGIGQAAAVGTAATPARADHVHPLAAAATPGASAVGDTAAAGTAATFAASDHKHGREGFGSVSALTAFGAASANGNAATVSHSDHQHGAPSLPVASLVASGIVQLGAAGSGAGNALSANDASTGNARTPTAHASTHATGGSDVLTPDAIGAVSAYWTDMFGLGLLTAVPTASGYTVAQPAALMSCFLCMAPKGKSVTRLGIEVTAPGATPSGLNALALYDESANLIDQTGDMSAAFGSTGFVEGSLSQARTLTAGANYYICVITNFSGTLPHLAATGTSGSANIPALNGHYMSLFKNAVASFPASFVPSALSINSGNYIAYAR